MSRKRRNVRFSIERTFESHHTDINSVLYFDKYGVIVSGSKGSVRFWNIELGILENELCMKRNSAWHLEKISDDQFLGCGLRSHYLTRFSVHPRMDRIGKTSLYGGYARKIFKNPNSDQIILLTERGSATNKPRSFQFFRLEGEEGGGKLVKQKVGVEKFPKLLSDTLLEFSKCYSDVFFFSCRSDIYKANIHDKDEVEIIKFDKNEREGVQSLHSTEHNPEILLVGCSYYGKSVVFYYNTETGYILNEFHIEGNLSFISTLFFSNERVFNRILFRGRRGVGSLIINEIITKEKKNRDSVKDSDMIFIARLDKVHGASKGITCMKVIDIHHFHNEITVVTASEDKTLKILKITGALDTSEYNIWKNDLKERISFIFLFDEDEETGGSKDDAIVLNISGCLNMKLYRSLICYY